ncbi:MAG: hypothetical protein U0Q15_20590 [Kineosporiaceae bacterium]
MYDIDRALRRLDLAHRLEELEHRRAEPGDASADGAGGPQPPAALTVPSPSPVPEVSAPIDVVTEEPRTLPNGLPIRTPGTRFPDRPKAGPSPVVIPLGQPLPPTEAPRAGAGLGWSAMGRPPASWAADHDVAPGPREEAGRLVDVPAPLPLRELITNAPVGVQAATAVSRRGVFTPDKQLDVVRPDLAAAALPGLPPAPAELLDGVRVEEAPAAPGVPAPAEQLSPLTHASGQDDDAEGHAPAAHADSAAERIAAMLRGGHPGLLA